MVYPKAIYMVEGEPFEVQELHYREDEEKVAYVKRGGGGLLHRRHQRQGRVDSPALHAAGDAGAGSRRAGRGAGGREGGRLQEDQDGHAGERGLGRGRSCRSRRCRPPAPGWPSIPPCSSEISPSRDGAGGRHAGAHLSPPPASRPIFLPLRRARRGGVARRRLAAEAGVVVTRETHARPAPRHRALHARRCTSTTASPAASASPSASSRSCPSSSRAGLEPRWRPAPAESGCPSCVGPVNEVGRRAKPIALGHPHAGWFRVAERRLVPWPRSRRAAARSSAASRRARAWERRDRPPWHPGRAGGRRRRRDRAAAPSSSPAAGILSTAPHGAQPLLANRGADGESWPCWPAARLWPVARAPAALPRHRDHRARGRHRHLRVPGRASASWTATRSRCASTSCATSTRSRRCWPRWTEIVPRLRRTGHL